MVEKMPQPHPSHKLKAYMGDYNKPTVFCVKCGKEQDEMEISEPCPGKIYISRVDKVELDK